MREMDGKKTRVSREYPTLPQTGNYFCGNVRLAEPEQDVSEGYIAKQEFVGSPYLCLAVFVRIAGQFEVFSSHYCQCLSKRMFM